MLAGYFDDGAVRPCRRGAEDDLPVVIEEAPPVRRAHARRAAAAGARRGLGHRARANRYLVEKEPWKLAKDPGAGDELASVLYAATETLRILAIAIGPIMPGAAERLWSQLGLADPSRISDPLTQGVGEPLPVADHHQGASLFPRLDG